MPLTIENFRNLNLNETIQNSETSGYLEITTSLKEAAKLAEQQNKQDDKKALLLLADACFMMLNSNSPTMPFSAYLYIDGGRSALPEDFDAETIELFAQLSTELTNPWLQARLADLVHETQRNPTYALLAIDAYKQLALTEKSWFYTQDCWKRAIQLSILYDHKNSESRLRLITTKILATLDTTSIADKYFTGRLADLLLIPKPNKNVLTPEEVGNIAIKMETIASLFAEKQDLALAENYFNLAKTWFEKSNNTEKQKEMTIKVAEIQIKQAEYASQQQSYLFANAHYKTAIQTYTSLPRKRRPEDIEEQIKQLHQKIRTTGQQTIENMPTIRIPISSSDINKAIDCTLEGIKGKPLWKALNTFLDAQSTNIKQLRESAIEGLKPNLLQNLFSSTYFAEDGRVIAKTPAIEWSKEETAPNEEAIRGQMMQQYKFYVNFFVLAHINPAHEVLRQEHNLQLNDFIYLAQECLVPIGRARLVGKALFMGYNGDFATAIHLLAPQLEHIVRYHLKEVGEKTTTIDKNGIEDEIGLSALMEKLKITEILNADLAFEIKALFCNSLGFNLRNDVAHGLLDDKMADSAASIYAWWFFFKLICRAL